MGTSFVDFFSVASWQQKQHLLQSHKSGDADFYSRVNSAKQALQLKPHLPPTAFATEKAYDGPLRTTPEILASRTYCEKTPAPIVACNEFLETYRKLYNIAVLAPVMDSVAVAFLPNNYYNNNIIISHTKGMEFFGSPDAVAHATVAGDIMFALPSYFKGAYKESYAGAVLIHEITHIAMYKVLNNAFLPYGKNNAQASQAYKQVIKETAARANHAFLPHISKEIADPQKVFCNLDPVGSTAIENYMIGRLQYGLCDSSSTATTHIESIAIAMQTVAYLNFEGHPLPKWIEPIVHYKQHYIDPELRAYAAVQPVYEALLYEALH